MKKLRIFIFFLLSISLYGQNTQKPDLEINIENKSVKIGDTLNLILKNNSRKKIYIIYDKSKPINYYFSNKVYISEINIIDSKNTRLSLFGISDDCFYPDTKIIKRINEIEILEIESKEVIKFNIPFDLRTTLSTSCWYEYEINNLSPNEKYYVQFSYKFYQEYLNSELCEDTKIEQKVKGYELYDKIIISNKVPFLR